MTVPRWLALLLACSAACSSDADDPEGALTVVLTTQANGVTYRLTGARFVLEGEAPRELTSGDQSELSVALPPGAYRLVLHEGYALTRLDDDAVRVGARLVSQNPLPLQITAGETTRALLRFELADGRALDGGLLGAAPPPGPDAAVGAADADASLDPEASVCAEALRIDEVDPAQEGGDDAELVEIVNPGACSAPLAGVRLELINGAGGKAYAQYDLAAAGAHLPAGARLVLGDEEVLAALPTGALALALRGSGLQNGPDAVRLRGPRGVLDAVAYGGAVAGSGEGMPAGKDDGPRSLARCPAAHDSNDNAADFRATPPTPGAPSACAAATDTDAGVMDAGRRPARTVSDAGADASAQKRSATMPSSSSQR